MLWNKVLSLVSSQQLANQSCRNNIIISTVKVAWGIFLFQYGVSVYSLCV